MKLEATRFRRHDVDNNLIPMINVVFLLLIFFIIAGSIRASDPVTLEPLESTQAQDLTAPIDLYIDRDGLLTLRDKEVSMDRLGTALIAGNNAEHWLDETPTLVLKADPRVSVANLRALLNALRGAGIQTVELVTTPVATSPATSKP